MKIVWAWANPAAKNKMHNAAAAIIDPTTGMHLEMWTIRFINHLLAHGFTDQEK
jgi:hypothetical protein